MNPDEIEEKFREEISRNAAQFFAKLLCSIDGLWPESAGIKLKFGPEIPSRILDYPRERILAILLERGYKILSVEFTFGEEK